MTEQEEFEFRLRLEKESPKAEKKPELSPSEQMRLGREQYAKSVREANPVLSKVGDLASGMTGIVRGGLNILSKPFVDEKLGEKGLGEKLLPTEFVDKSSGLYTTGSVADPAAWMIGMKGPQILAKVGSKPGVIKYVADALSKSAIGRGVQRAATGGAIGGTIGGLSDDGSAKTGAEIGAAANVLLPPTVSGVMRAGRNIKEHIYPSAGGLAVKASGDKADDVIRALVNTRSGVPGVNLTAGQASVPSGSAEFAALQKLVASKDPSRYMGIKAVQEAGRRGAIRGIGRDEAALNAAKAARSKAATPIYEAARGAGNVVDTSPVVAQIDDLLLKNPGNRALVSELKAIKEGLYDGKTLRTNAQQVSSVLDDLKAAIAKEDNKFIGEHLTNLKNSIAKAIPSYQKAQQVFAKESIPVNRMQVGQELEKSLVNSLGSAERPTVFAGAVENAPRTIKRATGAPRFDKLEEVLSPPQVNVVKAIMNNLRQNADYKGLASAGAKSLESRIGSEVVPPTGFFKPIVSAARSWINTILRSGDEIALRKLAPIMENPQQMAQLMQAATPQQRNVIESLISKYITTGTIIGGSQIDQELGGR